MSDFEMEGTVLKRYIGNNPYVVVPEGVTKIGYWAFDEAKRAEWDEENDLFCMESIKLPESLTMIDAEAFHCCAYLEEIVIPANVKSIESNAFSECVGLMKVVILNPDCDIDPNGVFEECPSEMIIYAPSDSVERISMVEWHCMEHGIRFRPLSMLNRE